MWAPSLITYAQQVKLHLEISRDYIQELLETSSVTITVTAMQGTFTYKGAHKPTAATNTCTRGTETCTCGAAAARSPNQLENTQKLLK